MTFQIGAGNDAVDRLDVATTNMRTSGEISAITGGSATSTTGASIAGATAGAAQAAISTIDTALDRINSERATFGALQNRFEAVIANLSVAAENQTAARSRIMDADFAKETAALMRAQILQQAGTAMLAQANQLPQQVLQLLQR
jgi:flagellin